jgi:uncharacterized lipoprotein YmbA
MHPFRVSVVAGLLLTGCFSLSRKSPPVERYVLGGIRTEPTSALATDGAGLSIGVRRLDLAPYLATLAIVVRREDNEIVTTGFHRWAESPSAGLNRAVSGYLAAAAGIASVDVAPWPVRFVPDVIVQLHVERMEGVASAVRVGEAQLLARWEIFDPTDGTLLARGRTDYRAPGWVVGDYGDLVARLDQGLLALTQELISCMRRVRTESASPEPVARDGAIACGMRSGETR